MAITKSSYSIDATSVLWAYLLVSFLIPSGNVFAPLGSLGAPSTVFASFVLIWWFWDRIHRRQASRGMTRPVRRAAILLMVVMLIVYRHAMLQPVVADELSAADSGLIRIMSLIGVTLVAADGITSMERMRALLNRIVMLVTAISLLAIVQFFTGSSWIDKFQLPGLTNSSAGGAVLGRAGFSRVSGTSLHPLEFGAVLAMLLPLVISITRIASTRKRLYRASAAIVGIAVLLSLSRTTLIGAAVSFAVLVSAWPRRARLVAVVSSLVLFLGASLAVPGLASTLRGLFGQSADDPSVLSRTAGIAYAEEMFSYNPWLGRGFGTFIPRYYIFDNGYLSLLMDAGVVGLSAMILLIASAAFSARAVAKRFAGTPNGELNQALFASAAAGGLIFAFFDLLSFAQSACCLMVVIGLCGASHRLT